jgi:hypothetical protein
MDKLDEAFAATTHLLFGKELSPMERYSKWLSQRVPSGERVKSCFGNGAAYLPQYGYFKKMPKDRVASLEDAAKASAPIIANAEGLSLGGMMGAVRNGAYFVPTYSEGNNIDVEDSFCYYGCISVKHVFDVFPSKRCAFALSIMDGEGAFGLFRCKAPKFSIHCYNAYQMQRCFEMDSAINCADSMFCHNVENLSNCLFCFNTKAKRYAIGNVEVGKEKYSEFRAQLAEKIASELEAKGRLDFDIYDVLAAKKMGKQSFSSASPSPAHL